jgi:hypothetical protein
MRRAVIAVLGFAAAGLAWAADAGIKARPDLSDYPLTGIGQSLRIGVEVLTASSVRQHFVSGLERKYLVLEAGVYPATGETIPLDTADFVIRVPGTSTFLRPADPRTAAGILQRTTPTERDIELYPQVGIGYSSGQVHDPVSGGTRRVGGMSQSVGLGVGVGGSRPGSTDADRETMEIELSEKALPSGDIQKPVAGYLYFPVQDARTWERLKSSQLEYMGSTGKVVVPLYHHPAQAPEATPENGAATEDRSELSEPVDPSDRRPRRGWRHVSELDPAEGDSEAASRTCPRALDIEARR